MAAINSCLILFPTQLFEEKYIKRVLEFEDNKTKNIILWENDYFFTKYNYHKLKLVFHRATMEAWYNKYNTKYDILYISNHEPNHIKIINNYLHKNKINQVRFYDPIELELKNNIVNCTLLNNKTLDYLIFDSPYFLNSATQNKNLINKMNTIRHDVFYKMQRINHKIMINKNNEPVGNKWSFDTENRLSYPKNQQDVDVLNFNSNNHKKYILEAITYVNKYFKNNYGNCKFAT